MADVQKWIDELRAGKVVGRIMLDEQLGAASRTAGPVFGRILPKSAAILLSISPPAGARRRV